MIPELNRTISGKISSEHEPSSVSIVSVKSFLPNQKSPKNQNVI